MVGKLWAIIAGIAIAAAVAFVFAPIVPYKGNTYELGMKVITVGIYETNEGWFNAQVSPSYSVFGCGVVFNPVVHILVPSKTNASASMTLNSTLWSLAEWRCKS